MGKKRFNVVLEKRKMGFVSFEGGADEVDDVVGVLSWWKEIVKWV